MELPFDHAPLSLSLIAPSVDIICTLHRAKHLGDHAALLRPTKPVRRKNISVNSISDEKFIETLLAQGAPLGDGEVDDAVKHLSEALYQCANASQVPPVPPLQPIPTTSTRWDRIIQSKNEKQIWDAINWRGELYDGSYSHNVDSCSPSDSQFKTHFEHLLHDSTAEPLNIEIF